MPCLGLARGVLVVPAPVALEGLPVLVSMGVELLNPGVWIDPETKL